MPAHISRAACAAMHRPTTRGRLRLANADIEVVRDLTIWGTGQAPGPHSRGAASCGVFAPFGRHR